MEDSGEPVVHSGRSMCSLARSATGARRSPEPAAIAHARFLKKNRAVFGWRRRLLDGGAKILGSSEALSTLEAQRS